MTAPSTPYRLPTTARVPDKLVEDIRRDCERFADDGLPSDLDAYLLDRYEIDVSARYAGFDIPNPWGKASGQLSMTARQVEEDVEAGLGFIVLKTVIAEDDAGRQTMSDWAIRESRMMAEAIVGRSGEEGWTVSWKGRGWWQSFDDYLKLIRDAREIADGTGTLIVPSCKYHLPTPKEDSWKVEEYTYTTGKLNDAWQRGSAQRGGGNAEQEKLSLFPAPHSPLPMPLEKDFSPTLAGSGRAAQQAKILEWLRTVPKLIRSDNDSVCVGLKLFNALFDDEFQLEMLRTIHQLGLGRPDFYIYGNRLFDPNREFDGHRGIAYGGPDLSDRNLRVMSAFGRELDGSAENGLNWSATGNINSGKIALEYALRGATSFQLHTFFQLPADQYQSHSGSKTAKALHELYFHPETGFVVWLHHLAAEYDVARGPIRFLDVVSAACRR